MFVPILLRVCKKACFSWTQRKRSLLLQLLALLAYLKNFRDGSANQGGAGREICNMCLRSLTESASWKDRWGWIEKKQTSLDRGMEMFAKGSTWISPAKGARVTKPGFSGQRWPRVGRDGGGREEGRREGGRTRRGRIFFSASLLFQRFFGPGWARTEPSPWLEFARGWERARVDCAIARSFPIHHSFQNTSQHRFLLKIGGPKKR